MSTILYPLLAMLACSTRQELARQVAYLKEENRILRSRLTQLIMTTPQERSRLVRAGRKLGLKIKELMTISTYISFRRWVREIEGRKSVPRRTLVVLADLGRTKEFESWLSEFEPRRAGATHGSWTSSESSASRSLVRRLRTSSPRPD
jgi:hypothetical protein